MNTWEEETSSKNQLSRKLVVSLVTLLIWSKNLTNTAWPHTQMRLLVKSALLLQSRHGQQGLSLAGKGRSILSLHSSVPRDLSYCTSLNNSVKTPTEAGSTSRLVLLLLLPETKGLQGKAAGGGGVKSRRERTHTGRSNISERERKEDVHTHACLHALIRVWVPVLTPARRSTPQHLIHPIKQQRWWTPKDWQQCCGATNKD